VLPVLPVLPWRMSSNCGWMTVNMTLHSIQRWRKLCRTCGPLWRRPVLGQQMQTLWLLHQEWQQMARSPLSQFQCQARERMEVTVNS